MNFISKMNRSLNPFSVERKLADINVEPETMKEVLITIAHEVQRYHKPPETTHDIKTRHDDVSTELTACKAKLRLKKILIQSLRKNLKSAYSMTRKCNLTQKKEIQTLNSQVSEAREENAKLAKKNDESEKLIEKLQNDVQVLNEKLENITTFIDLGYKELQKIRTENVLDLSSAMKLKHIMICCGEYYANYRNEHDTCLKLEQRNRFLTNKLQITENTLATANDKLHNLQNLQSMKNKYLYHVKDKRTKIGNHTLGVGSEISIIDKPNVSKSTSYSLQFENKENIFNSAAFNELKNIDLSSHMSLVKKMLDDQDSMLKDLKELKAELETDFN